MGELPTLEPASFRSHIRPETPQNGSMILYNRKKVKYRKDGYCWKKRKDGKTTREDHMKLKVQGVEASDVQWLRRGRGCESGSERPSGACERQPCVAGVDVSVCCYCPVCSAVLAQQPV
ncbi:calmodulin-binding transcription activator 1 isoform X1 [Lates japonicus]|uniref:Calmodulin-binding transcription activator 1 isoform X1 n=1 Tax=Lates japonicus TaxID=270547 RepID=A0AAD3NI48_LATJO|nr:calmodulin-binding transcription activator 1 isoform X1 [Lates japonicus]